MNNSPPESVTFVGQRTEALLGSMIHAETQRWLHQDERLGEGVQLLANMVMGRGKRLRAAFVYWSWVGASGWLGVAADDDAEVLNACAAFELLQAFALIHDDIMDDAATRRGIPTIHTSQAERLEAQGWRGEPRRYGEGVAILLGDLAHVYADRCMTNANVYSRQLWDELRIELNLGQYLDIRSSAAGDADRSTAQAVATFKSALYTIVRPLQMGATMATGWSALQPSAREVALQRLEDFGRPLGQAFQLRDDLLGVLGDTDNIGKPVGGDLQEGKATELLSIALERANPTQNALLARVGRTLLSPDQIASIVEVLHETGAVAEIEQRIDSLIAQANAAIPTLRVDPSTQVTMSELARYVGKRTH